MLDLTQPRDARIDRRLREETIAFLSTVRPDGRPHLVPIWFLWDGETILIFSQPANQKVRNLRQNPRAMLALERGGDAPVILIEGEATLLDEGAAAATDPAYVEKYAAGMANLGMDAAQMAAVYRQPIRITPTKFIES
ncbi:MAG: TIGR03618 family F420-dependent PPOX class oxidoreductase [Chloroflexota bacterium]|nr:TIGR03618 family F420-dependent PPOX class oxidoreductase [Chloroflexota bacterium]